MIDEIDIIDFFNERAGIYEHDAGNTRSKANILAKQDIKEKFNLTEEHAQRIFKQNQ